MSALPVRRTPSEMRAYLDGFAAAASLFEERLKRHVAGDGSAIRAAAAEVRAIRDVEDHEAGEKARAQALRHALHATGWMPPPKSWGVDDEQTLIAALAALPPEEEARHD